MMHSYLAGVVPAFASAIAMAFAQQLAIDDGLEADSICVVEATGAADRALSEAFFNSEIRVEASLLKDLADAVGVASCKAIDELLLRLEDPQIPVAERRLPEEIPTAVVLAVEVSKRVVSDIMRRGEPAEIEALALTTALGINPMLRADGRKIGFVDAICTSATNAGGYRVRETAAACDERLAVATGLAPIGIFDGFEDVCTGSANIRRGRTVTCECMSDTANKRLRCG